MRYASRHYVQPDEGLEPAMSAFTPRRRGRSLAFAISIAVIAGLALVGVALLQQPSPHGSVGSPLTVIATPSAQPSASPSLTPSPSPQPTLSAAPPPAPRPTARPTAPATSP